MQREAGASKAAFPSWSLGTSEKVRAAFYKAAYFALLGCFLTDVATH